MAKSVENLMVKGYTLLGGVTPLVGRCRWRPLTQSSLTRQDTVGGSSRDSPATFDGFVGLVLLVQ